MWSFIYQTFHIRILCAKYSENWVIQFGNEVENAKSFQMDRCWTHFDQKSSFQHWLRLAIKVKLAQMSYKGQIKPSCLYKHSTINKTSDFIFTKRLNFKFMFWSKDWMSAWYFSENKKFYIMYILLLTINNIIVLIWVIKTQNNEL